jgi:hypothetical protein
LKEDEKGEGVKFECKWFVEYTDKEGKKHKIPLGENMVVNSGLNLILSRLYSASSNPVSHVAIGTGTAAEDASQTSLGSETARASASFTLDSTNKKLNFSATFTATQINGTTEIGLFNASSGGTMLSRKKLSSAFNIPATGNVTISGYIQASR